MRFEEAERLTLQTVRDLNLEVLIFRGRPLPAGLSAEIDRVVRQQVSFPQQLNTKGVDEGEYAVRQATENLEKLRTRVQGTAEQGLGAAGRTGRSPQ